MGSACVKSNESQVMQPQSNLEIAINNEFTPFLRLEHPLNVNHKYVSFCVFNRNEIIGQGIKKTFSYKVNITKEELGKKRSEFWETRVEGNPHSWAILRQAIEASEKDSIAILAAGGLKLVNKSIQIAYDEQGHKYDIPVFCINEPTQYESLPPSERNLISSFETATTTLTVRCTLVGEDVKLENISNTLTVEEVKKIFIETSKKDIEKLRFFISGREMFDSKQLGNYGITNEPKIIQAYAWQAKQTKA